MDQVQIYIELKKKQKKKQTKIQKLLKKNQIKIQKIYLVMQSIVMQKILMKGEL